MLGSQRLLFPNTESRIIIGTDTKINHDKLLSVIELNEIPGSQRPNMVSERFDPMDFIEAIGEEEGE